MTAGQTIVFTEAFLNCATAMGWNKGSKQITTWAHNPKPDDCYLGKQHKDEQKKKPHKANSATVAAAATSATNPHFTTLMAAMANLNMNE